MVREIFFKEENLNCQLSKPWRKNLPVQRPRERQESGVLRARWKARARAADAGRDRHMQLMKKGECS